MFGNYPVNDDWIFVRQIEAFNQGIFSLNAELDPSFISQGFLGLLWGKVFGISFINLQILTFLITLLATLVFIYMLKEMNLKKSIIVLCAVLFFFNPIIFISAFTFMTENYYLLFFSGSVYFYLKYLQNKNKSFYMVVGSILVLISILIRQVGILIGLSLIIILLFDFYRNKKLNKTDMFSIAIVSCFIIIGLLTTIFWPRFSENRILILPEQFSVRFQYLLLSVHYFPLFVLPLLAGLKVKIFKNKLIAAISVLVFIFLLWFLYNFDFYPIGNVFYLEELYTKSDFRSAFSLFDNIFFKSLFAVLTAFCVTKLLIFILMKIRNYTKIIKTDPINLFILILGLSNFLILLFSSDFYDRYLIPAFICFFLLFIKNYSGEIKVNKFVVFCLIIVVFIVVTLQWEFSSKNRLMWDQARALSEKTGLESQIYLNDTYTNYIITQKENDFTGLIERKSFEKKCFIQDYSVDSNSKVLEYILNLEDYIDGNILEKKKPYLVNKKEGLPRVNKHIDNLIYNQEYFSLLFNTVGRRIFVASWCDETD